MKTLPATNNRDLLLLLCSGVLLTLLVRTAWQADDAYAAWRLVDNFVHGYGLRYNIDERVQTFTSTSWTFLVAAFVVVFKNIYYTSIFLSIALTLGTAWIVTAPFRQTSGTVIFAYTALLLSASFLDFSVGGFENPLSHFLLACFALVFFRGGFDSAARFRILCVLAGLGGLTRLDLLAYFAVPLAFAAWSSPLSRRDKLIGLACCALPIALWHSFTLFYFGFPLQNAAYAKRFNNLPLGEYLRAGVDYYLNILQRDPITLPVILSGLVLGLRSRDNALRCFVSGIGIYLIYIFLIGGDYMSGRFFTVAYLAAVIAILRSGVLQETESSLSATALLVILGCLAVHPTFTTGKTFGDSRERNESSEWLQRGISDERSSWYQNSGLLLASRLSPMPRPSPGFDFLASRDAYVADVNSGRSPRVTKLIPTGYAGFYMPREIHVYDTNGQVDPLMARLPIIVGREWKVGHLFKPDVPGYEQTLITGENKIVDPDIAAYYDKLRIITRGDLFSFERLLTIVKMNLGRYDHHLRAYEQRLKKST